MKFSGKIDKLLWTGTLGCTVAVSILAMGIQPIPSKATMTQLAQALSPEEVNLRAKQIIVRIDGANIGSGSLIDYSDNVYTVLSNWHVMQNSGNYIVQTIDGRKHQINPSSIQQLPGLDLAIFQFSSNQNYQIAEIGSTASLNEGQSVYFAGYPGELRREDNRYYRFFTANLVGVLSKSTENGYSLIYSGEAFPGMSGGPVFNKEGLVIGVHGEANVHALSGGTSNYAIPIERYQNAVAKLNSPPIEKKNTPETIPPANINVTIQPEVDPNQREETKPTPPKADNINQPEESKPSPPKADNSNQSEESNNPDNISSVPTFTPDPVSDKPNPEVQNEPEVIIEPETPQETNEPEVVIESETPQETNEPKVVTEPQPQVSEAQDESTADTKPKPTSSEDTDKQQIVTESQSNESESEIIDIPTTPRKITLISQKTGIDYTKLRSLLKEEKWSEADLHTYRLVEQIIKTAKQQNKHVFIELKTIAEFSCPDIRTIDYLWKKYSGDKFGFSSQQKIWQSVNQKGDFSTQTWRRFATEVGWKTGEVANSSGYLLYEQLNFEPTKAPEGHLPWWFALPDEEQKVIKHLFARCNLNPTVQELEAEAKRDNPRNTTENSDPTQGEQSNNRQPNINKDPKSSIKTP